MADPPFSPKSKPSFFVISLAGQNPNPIVPDVFFATHFEGKNEIRKLKLTSDATDRTWQVKLNGRRFSDGWEDFSNAHSLRDDDVLIFRDDGRMIFHVTPSGRSFSQIHFISSRSDDSNSDSDSDDETWDKASDSRIISLKKKSRLEQESSSFENSCIIGVTSSNLSLNRVNLAKSFTVANGLQKNWSEIDLINQSGKSWVMGLRHNKRTGQEFMRGGWTSFCRENKLKTGSFYRFELVLTGTRPALQLCSDNSPQGSCLEVNGKAKVSAKLKREDESPTMNQSKFMRVTLKPYMLKSRQLNLRSSFARVNGIKKGEKIILVDKNGGEWPSHVASANVNGGFYLSKGWSGFCKASGVTTGETFTLKFVREKCKTPMLQFCSKAKIVGTGKASRDEEEAQGETETRFRKRTRVSAGESSRHTQGSDKSTVDPENLQCKQPLQTISQQVRQSIVDVLADVRRFRSELKIKEQNLEAVLQEVDVLGEKVSEINRLLK